MFELVEIGDFVAGVPRGAAVIAVNDFDHTAVIAGRIGHGIVFTWFVRLHYIGGCGRGAHALLAKECVMYGSGSHLNTMRDGAMRTENPA